MSEKTIWVSFDLGLKGDYTGMYAWLDTHDARECNNYLAILKYGDSKDFLAEIENEVRRCVKLAEDDRVYLIWKEEDTGKLKGKFIHGARKRAPWHGYG